MVYTYVMYRPTSKTISLIQLYSVLSCNKHILWNFSRIQSISTTRELWIVLSHLKATFRIQRTNIEVLFSIYVDFHIGHNRKQIYKLHCRAIAHRILLNLLHPCVLIVMECHISMLVELNKSMNIQTLRLLLDLMLFIYLRHSRTKLHI